MEKKDDMGELMEVAVGEDPNLVAGNKRSMEKDGSVEEGGEIGAGESS